MNTILPVAPAPSPSAVTSNATPTSSAPIAAVSGTLLAAGLAVAQLAPGSLLRALVAGKNEAGQLILDLGKVKVALATQANLSPGSEIVLQVRSSGPRMQVTIQPVNADGQPAARQGQTQPQGAGVSPSPPPAAESAEAVEARMPHVAGLTTTAVVVGGPPLGTGAAGKAPPMPGAVPPPADGKTPSPAAAEPTPSAAGGPLPSSPSSPVPALSAGTSVTLRINAVLPPGQPLPSQPAQPQLPSPIAGQTAQAPAALPMLQTGVVAGFTTAGHPLVQTQAGLLLLSAKLTAPVGATIVIEVEPASSDEVEQAAAPAARLAGGRASSSPAPAFPRLDQALQSLREDGVTLPPSVAKHLPHTGPRLAEGLINAATAARDESGFQALERLLRPALERLGHHDIAEALHQELSRPASSPGSTTQADWRAFTLPVMDDGQLHQLRIYERQHRGGQQGGGAQTGSRFVVEVEMSRLGTMQLDGLVQPKRFDLMLRSRQALPEAMRRDIAALFAEARSAAGFAGEIGFQQTAVFPVNPTAAENHRPGVVV
jgi:hypothetical protein